MRGVTLIELLVVMAIIAILASVGFVGYTSWVRSQRAEEDLEKLYKMLVLTRAKSFLEKRVCGLCWNGTSPADLFYIKCDTNGDGELDTEITREKLGTKFNTPDIPQGCIKFFPEGYTNNVGTFEVEYVSDVPYRRIVVGNRRIKKER